MEIVESKSKEKDAQKLKGHVSQEGYIVLYIEILRPGVPVFVRPEVPVFCEARSAYICEAKRADLRLCGSQDIYFVIFFYKPEG